MHSIIALELPRLAAFFIVLFIYYFYVEDDGDVYVTTILKILPIFTLVIYVFTGAMTSKPEFKYSHNIVTGLGVSMIGDILLNWDYFTPGMLAFGVAQVFYIKAFDLKPFKHLFLGFSMYALALSMVVVVFKVFPGLEIDLMIGLPIYAILLITMCWRSIVRSKEVGGVFTTLGAIGSVFFVASDSTICVDKFLRPIPNARIYIMTTYYIAQFLIAISTLNDTMNQPNVKIQTRSKVDARRAQLQRPSAPSKSSIPSKSN